MLYAFVLVVAYMDADNIAMLTNTHILVLLYY